MVHRTRFRREEANILHDRIELTKHSSLRERQSCTDFSAFRTLNSRLDGSTDRWKQSDRGQWLARSIERLGYLQSRTYPGRSYAALCYLDYALSQDG